MAVKSKATIKSGTKAKSGVKVPSPKDKDPEENHESCSTAWGKRHTNRNCS
jgi:hypothetical protein